MDPLASMPNYPPIWTAAGDRRKPPASREAARQRRLPPNLSTRRKEAAQQKERERRQQAVDKAQAALDKAEREHAERAAAIQAEVQALDQWPSIAHRDHDGDGRMYDHLNNQEAMIAALRSEPKFSELFMAYLLTRNSRVEGT
jgi:hypothetical protein